jgi:hypothetical protein
MAAESAQSEAEKLQQRFTESADALISTLSKQGKELKALQAKVEAAQRDNKRLQAELHAKRHRFSPKATPAEILQDDDILRQVLEYVGPDEYLFSGSINRKCRQMQTILSQRAAAANGRTSNKLRTSFAACISSSERLLWAFGSGLKQKVQKKPVQLVQAVLRLAVPAEPTDPAESTGPAKVLALLNVQNCEAKDAAEGIKLCANAAERGDMQLLQWLRAHGCAWDGYTCSCAAHHGHLDVLMWATEQGCPWSDYTCDSAASGGHLHILQWARANGCRWDAYTCQAAVSSGDLQILQWLREHGCPWDEKICFWAARDGHLHILQWAREQGCPWDTMTAALAVRNSHLHVLEWARANDCPWDLGKVLLSATADCSIKGLEWLQQNSERPWTAAEMISMLEDAGTSGELVALRWLRNCGAEWPSNFYSFYSNADEIEGCWEEGAVMWALANGCTWGQWQCEDFIQDLPRCKEFAAFFAWAHEHGCPCTCTGGNAAAAAAANENN